MKVEATITIEADLLKQVDDVAGNFESRSQVFEKALQNYLPKVKDKTQKQLSEEEEIALINRYADEHREEILETLSYQIDW